MCSTEVTRRKYAKPAISRTPNQTRIAEFATAPERGDLRVRQQPSPLSPAFSPGFTAEGENRS